jgi:hypothetical protein
MRTVIVSIPDKKAPLVASFFKRNRLKTKEISKENKEDAALAKWIDEGMKSEDVPIEKIFSLLKKKHGANS